MTNSAGLTGASSGAEGIKYLSLFQRLSISLEATSYSGIDKFLIPYDVCCPTVSDFIPNRTCSTCKLYFPSNKMVLEHKREMHPTVKVNELRRTRPVRIAAKRQRQLMAIIASGMLF